MSSSPPTSILIVEDERIVAMDLQQTLNAMGHDAFAVAASAEEAVARASEKRPDVVLMDIRIKGPRDGIQTAEILRDRFGVIVIYLTAHADEAMIERAKLTEPLGYLLKPVKQSELRSVIEIAVYRHELEKARKKAADLESQKQILEQTAQLKDTFLANMSHELRTPLNGVIGFAALMHDGMAGPISDEHRRFLGHVLDSGRRFLQVINDVLDLSNIEAGRWKMHIGDVDLPATIGNVTSALHPLLQKKQQQFTTELDSACAPVVNDAAMLEQIVYNYLSNAIKFTPPRGTIRLRVLPDDSLMFRIEVEDSGIGIAPDDLKRLFLPFEQLHSGRMKSVEGAGLGLAVTRRLAELQGGRVGVDSAPGGGSIFYVVLPLKLEGRNQSA
ncbi:MAG: ATP-binding protein [Burkholderiaceae bacterium]|jgi:signal transduction histidine kinase